MEVNETTGIQGRKRKLRKFKEGSENQGNLGTERKKTKEL